MKKPQLMALAAALALAATGVHAQSYNDNGSPVNGSGINIDGPYVPSGGPICPSGPVVSAFTGATTQLGRIFRDGVAATCPIKAYPGIFSATATFNYESYTYSNTSAAAACVTINFDPDTAGANAGAPASLHRSRFLRARRPGPPAPNPPRLRGRCPPPTRPFGTRREQGQAPAALSDRRSLRSCGRTLRCVHARTS